MPKSMIYRKTNIFCPVLGSRSVLHTLLVKNISWIFSLCVDHYCHFYWLEINIIVIYVKNEKTMWTYTCPQSCSLVLWNCFRRRHVYTHVLDPGLSVHYSVQVSHFPSDIPFLPGVSLSVASLTPAHHIQHDRNRICFLFLL